MSTPYEKLTLLSFMLSWVYQNTVRGKEETNHSRMFVDRAMHMLRIFISKM